MKRKSIVVAVAAMSCFVWASAQEARQDRQDQQGRQDRQTQSASQAAATGMLWSANESIGANVVNAKGEDLGHVEDIVLDRNQSRIAYVIVSYGGLLGFGDKHFAVPWQAFGQTADRDLSLQIDPEQLKNAPGFEKGTLPNTADPLFHEEVHSFYDAKPYSLDQQEQQQRQETADAQAQATREHSGERTSDWSNWDWTSWVSRGDDTTWARRMGDLIGTKIENAQGETIAELEDVIVDSREARAAYAVVSFGGTLGFFADTAIIPWNALRLDQAREAYVTDATRAQLEQAKLSDTEYRNLEDRKYSEALFSSFRTQPYWEEYGYEAKSDQAARIAEAKAKADQAPAARDIAARDQATAARDQDGNKVTGTVVSVGSYPAASQETESEGGVRVRIRTESGSVRTVHLATSKELQEQELTIARGDKVVITGETQDFRGHNVLVAHEVQKNGGRTITLKK